LEKPSPAEIAEMTEALTAASEKVSALEAECKELNSCLAKLLAQPTL
jgi:hypothetical protein